MFVGDEVDVQGYSWCRNERRRVSVASLTRKVLCRNHNSILSDIDYAGGEARKAFSNAINNSSPTNPTVNSYRMAFIDGLRFERWCLKALVSLSFGGDLPIGSNARGRGQVEDEIVRIVYGRSDFQENTGLYSIGNDGEPFSCAQSMRIGPFVKNGHIFGGLFIILTFRFALFLEPMNATHLNFVTKDGQSLMTPSKVVYHPGQLGVAVQRVPWIFNFEWSNDGP